MIGETVRRRQWYGLMLGLAGVALVVYSKVNLAGLSPLAIGYTLFALVSITAGTMYQRRLKTSSGSGWAAALFDL